MNVQPQAHRILGHVTAVGDTLASRARALATVIDEITPQSIDYDDFETVAITWSREQVEVGGTTIAVTVETTLYWKSFELQSDIGFSGHLDGVDANVTEASHLSKVLAEASDLLVQVRNALDKAGWPTLAAA